MEAITLDKLEGARRQLDCAIELYFNEGDPVAVHTLAAAAFDVITYLRKRDGQPDEMLELILPERRAEFLQIWRAAQNFFKHADRDPEAVFDFNAGTTEVVLFLAAQRFAALEEVTVAMRIMIMWFCLHHPDLLAESAQRSAVEGFSQRMRHWDRATFWEQMQQVASEEAHRRNSPTKAQGDTAQAPDPEPEPRYQAPSDKSSTNRVLLR